MPLPSIDDFLSFPSSSAVQETASNVDPSTVTSPRRVVSDLSVLYDGKLLIEGDPWSVWSVARMTWNGT